MESATMFKILFCSLLISLCVTPSQSGTPSISRCPETIFRSVSTSSATVPVTWEDPECGLNPHVSHSKESQFRVGVHTVTYWFSSMTQMNPNQRCCSFDIFVSGPDFDLCTQNWCALSEICVPGIDHYTCYKPQIQMYNCSETVIYRLLTLGPAPAKWVEPSAYDILGRPLVGSTDYDGSPFVAGDHTIVYNFEDAFGTTASCSFRVIVAEGTYPGYQYCPMDIRVQSSDDVVRVEWLEPTLQENEDPTSVVFTQTHSPGQHFPVPSTTTVRYMFHDDSELLGNTCSFKIITSRPDYSPNVENLPNSKFVRILRNLQSTTVWPKPYITRPDGGYTGTVVYPSRGQPLIRDTSHVYPKGFYPVTYMFTDLDGTEIDVAEFVIVYHDGTGSDNIQAICLPGPHTFFSEVPVGSNMIDLSPWFFAGDESDLAWREDPEMFRSDESYSLGETVQNFQVYQPSVALGTTCVVRIMIIDNIRPVVSNCPYGDIVRIAPQGGSSMLVNFYEPTAVDGGESVTPVFTGIPSRPPFLVEVGETFSASYAFSDQMGNSANPCEFQIRVIAETAIPPAVIINCGPKTLRTASLTASLPPADRPVAIYDGMSVPSIITPGSFNVGTVREAVASFPSLPGETCRFEVTVEAIPPATVTNCEDRLLSTQFDSASLPADALPLAFYDGEMMQPILQPRFPVNQVTTVTASFLIPTSDTCEFTVTVLDLLPPEVTDCNQSLTVEPEEGGVEFIRVNWTEPSSVDSLSGGELATQSHSPLDPLPVDMVTVVEYLFVDRVGLETRCYVNISVLEAPPYRSEGTDNSTETPEPLFSNDHIVMIVVTAVATFLVCLVIFMLSLCCCTCCCEIEQKSRNDIPVPPRGRSGSVDDEEGAPREPGSGYSEAADQGNRRFVIKIPGLGKVPIYGPVYALNQTSPAQPRQVDGDPSGYDRPDRGDTVPEAGNGGVGGGGGYGGAGALDFRNEAFQPDKPETVATLDRVIDERNDGQVYGYDEAPPTLDRGAPPLPSLPQSANRTVTGPPLPPKPGNTERKVSGLPPTLSQGSLVAMQLELGRIAREKAKHEVPERYIESGGGY